MAKNEYHEHLLQVPLFAGLDHDELDAVGQTATELDYEAGRVLMREGARAHEMFVVLEGTVEVTQDGEHVADIGAGGFVGEMALLAHSARNSTVTAKTDVVVLHIDGREFGTLMTRVPELAAKMLPVVATRVVENSDHHSH
ncbi:cyclic nucleotide-binding domain-containing protein [Ilumatobacter sp.]|uniref:cyclic nucleotide-binding domain-containing protein n=1 Tax=Ilumatobacter sp. TaxID=1967498 RepID=UPI003AF7EC41